MYRRMHRGLTMVEALMVISVFALIFISVTAMVLQASRLYAKTSVHIEPQQSQILALKRMEREIREAMTIAPMPNVPESNYVDIVMPQKDANGRYQVTKTTVTKEVTNPDTGLTENVSYDYLSLAQENKRIRFFLGANPDGSGNVDTIYRAEVSADGATLLTTPTVIISGVLDDPAIFAFTPFDASTGITGATLITIRLTVPVQVHTAQGIETVNNVLSTQFRMRNLHSAT